MKNAKKLLPALLLLCILAALLTTAAQATEARPPLWVAGVDITRSETQDEAGNKTVTAETPGVVGTISGGSAALSYDEEDGHPVLTLTDFVYEGAGYTNGYDDTYSIYFNEKSGNDFVPLTIVLVGENSVTNVGVGNSSCALYARGDLTISGEGSLIATAGRSVSDSIYGTHSSHGICCGGEFTLTSGTVIAAGGEATDGSYGIYSFNGQACTVTGGTLTVTGGTAGDRSYGVYCSGDFTVGSDAVVTASGDTCAFSGKVKNALVGGGCATADGAGAWTEIEIETDAGRDLDDKKAVFPFYGLWVGGTQVTAENAADIPATGNLARNGGMASFNPASNVLTLTNYVYEGAGYVKPDSVDTNKAAALWYQGAAPLTIRLSGDENSLTQTGGDDLSVSCGVYVLSGGLTIQGTGSLTVASGTAGSSYGIMTTNHKGEENEASDVGLTVAGVTLTAAGGTATSGSSYGIISTSHSSRGASGVGLAITDATVTATGGTASGDNSYGVYANSVSLGGASGSGVIIVNSTLTANGGAAGRTSYGLYGASQCIAANGNAGAGILVESGTVTAKGGTGGTSVGAWGESLNTAGGGGAGKSGYGLLIRGGTLTATGGAADDYSYGAYCYSHNHVGSGTGASGVGLGVMGGELTGRGGPASHSYGVYGWSQNTNNTASTDLGVRIQGGKLTGVGGEAEEESCGVYGISASNSGTNVSTVSDGLYVAGGTLTGTGGAAKKSYGVAGRSEKTSGSGDSGTGVTVNGGELTGRGGPATGERSVSCGIYGSSVNHADSSNSHAGITFRGGTVDAAGGPATGQESTSYGAYGHSYKSNNGGTSGFGVDVAGSTLTAAGGVADVSCGLCGVSENVIFQGSSNYGVLHLGGTVKATGDPGASASYGVSGQSKAPSSGTPSVPVFVAFGENTIDASGGTRAIDGAVANDPLGAGCEDADGAGVWTAILEGNPGEEWNKYKRVVFPAALVSLTLDANDGSNAASTYSVPSGVEVPLISAFTGEGCAIVGWATAPNGQKVYDNGSRVALTAATTLYAKWISTSGACGAEGADLTWTLTDSDGDAVLDTLTISGTGAMKDFTDTTDPAPWKDAKPTLKTLVIEDGVTTIGNGGAFSGCTALTGPLTFPDSLQRIGGGAFGGCTALTSIASWDGVRTIDGGAFGGCSGLKSLDLGDSVQTISGGAFANCSSLTTVSIGAGIETIGGGAFGGCNSLTTVTIRGKVEDGAAKTEIDSGAFSNNQSIIAAITLGEGVRTIGAGAFTDLANLTTLNLSRGLETIEPGAFAGCRGLAAVLIPDTVTAVGFDAFKDAAATVYYNGAGGYDTASWAMANGAVLVPYYKITISSDHGTVTTAGADAGAVARTLAGWDCYLEGAAVTVTAAPDAGYALASLTAVQGENEIQLADGTFPMPAGGVTLTARWKSTSEEATVIPPAPTGTTEVTQNPDGSTTTTVTDPKTGTVTKTTVAPDGTAVTVKTDGEGKVTEQTATVSEAAAQSGQTVTLPVTIEKDTTITVTVPADQPTRVEIPVENAAASTVAVLVKEDGTEEILKTCTTGDKGVVVTVTGSATVKIVDNAKAFGDVAEDKWYAQNVAWVASRGIMVGDGRDFHPEEETSRAEIVQLLFNLEGAEADGNLAAFADVNADDWYAAAVTWAFESGIARGEGERFGAAEAVSREQLAVMLYNYAKYKGCDVAAAGNLSAFHDGGEVSSWAEEAMSWAVGVGLFRGTGSGRLSPAGTADRAQVAALIQRFCEKLLA